PNVRRFTATSFTVGRSRRAAWLISFCASMSSATHTITTVQILSDALDDEFGLASFAASDALQPQLRGHGDADEQLSLGLSRTVFSNNRRRFHKTRALDKL